MKCLYYALTVLLSLFLSVPNTSERKAQTYVDGHRAAWYGLWSRMGICPEIAEAVVYPEILRYSTLQDIVESTLNYSTYVTTGSKGFNFSVGRFQIKPSFVEQLEAAWMQSGLDSQFHYRFDTGDTRQARRQRIRRMQKEKWQPVYLGMFLRMLYWSYGGLDGLSFDEQVRLIANAYNRGCPWPEAGTGDLDILRHRIADKTFHFTLGSGRMAEHYAYPELALDWFHEVMPGPWPCQSLD